MILFKACPRCGGDIDATYQDDAYCVQCGNRPHVAFPGPRVVANHEPITEDWNPMREHMVCPSCSAEKVVKLDKVRTDYNTCYRCHPCGHIYSPSAKRTRERGSVREM